MKATRRRLIKFNLGNFEMYEVEAGIEYDDSDMDDETADARLDEMMREDVHRGELATSQDPGQNDTSVFKFNELMEG